MKILCYGLIYWLMTQANVDSCPLCSQKDTGAGLEVLRSMEKEIEFSAENVSFLMGT